MKMKVIFDHNTELNNQDLLIVYGKTPNDNLIILCGKLTGFLLRSLCLVSRPGVRVRNTLNIGGAASLVAKVI